MFTVFKGLYHSIFPYRLCYSPISFPENTTCMPKFLGNSIYVPFFPSHTNYMQYFPDWTTYILYFPVFYITFPNNTCQNTLLYYIKSSELSHQHTSFQTKLFTFCIFQIMRLTVFTCDPYFPDCTTSVIYFPDYTTYIQIFWIIPHRW